MRWHAAVSKDGRKLRTYLHPSRRVAPSGATLLRMRTEFAASEMKLAQADGD